MTTEQIFTHCALILPEEIVHGTIVVRDGVIADMSSGQALVRGSNFNVLRVFGRDQK